MARPMSRTDPIAAIYDAALEAGAWAHLPEVLARAVDGGSAILWTADAQAGLEAVTHGIPEAAQRDYQARYCQVDPWYLTACERGVGFSPTLGTDLVPESRFRQSEFFTDFARHIDTIDVVGGQVRLGPGRMGGIGIHRPRRVRRFNERHVARLQALFPHLQRAMQLRERLRLADAAAGFAALDALAIGAVICDRAGRVLFANRAAQAAAAGGAGIVLGDARRGIGALHGDQAKVLASLIRNVVCGGAGGGTTLTGEGGARLFVLVAPLPPRLADEPGRVLVTMRPADAGPTFGSEILVRLFGLTSAEAALALALFAGRSVAEVMEARGVTENTVRTQLASVLRKTETANQRDLVRLIGLLPPLR